MYYRKEFLTLFFKSFKISFLLWFLFPGGIVLWGQTPFCMEADCQRSGFFNSWLVLAGIAGGCHVWLNIPLQWWTCKACHSGSSSFTVALCSGGPWTRGCLYKNNPLMDPSSSREGLFITSPFHLSRLPLFLVLYEVLQYNCYSAY